MFWNRIKVIFIFEALCYPSENYGWESHLRGETAKVCLLAQVKSKQNDVERDLIALNA